MIGFVRRFLTVCSVAALLAADGCSKRQPDGAADQARPDASDMEQADRKAPEEAKTKPPPLPDMSE